MSQGKPSHERDARMLTVVLLVALLHGLLYVFLVPPWQHYDEPTHFELAWLTARQGALPQPGETDLAIQREIALSMRAHDFFRDAGFEPPLEVNGFIWLGQSQVGNRPLYYYLAALPVLLLEGLGVEAMLYGARLVSLVCLLVTVLAAWGVVGQLTPPGHRLRFLLPLALALLPTFVDVMTAVNNDALAGCLAALAVWLSLRLIRGKFAWWALLAVPLLAVLIFFTKDTAYPLILLLFLAVLLMLARGRLAGLRTWVWASLAAAGVLFLALSVIPGDAARWYRVTAQDLPTRTSSQAAVLGDTVFQLDSQFEHYPDWFTTAIFQPLPEAAPPQNQVYTLGLWAWSSPLPAGAPPLEVRLTLGFGKQVFSQTVALTQEPAFYTLTGAMSTDAYLPFRLVLTPVARERVGAEPLLVYLDGIVVAPGEFPADQPPEFNDVQGSSGAWGGTAFTNLVRNGSAEQSGWAFRPVVDRLGARLLPDKNLPSLLLTSLLDGAGSRQYYARAAQWLAVTYWGRFGWSHVPLAGLVDSAIFVGYTLVALGATVVWTAWGWFGKRRRLRGLRDEILFLTLAVALPWLVAWLRAPLYLGLPNLFLPVARYALPAAIPTTLAVNLGLVGLYHALDQRLSARGWVTAIACVGGWAAYAVAALCSIWMFYR